MSPKRFDLDGTDHQNQQLKSGSVIKGPRPTPLKLKQESHTIHKHHSNHQQEQKIKKPIIIYIHSPEVIHTKPHDFMALVQKLTGQNTSSTSIDQEQQQQQMKIKKTIKQDHGYDLNDDDKGLMIRNMSSPLFKTPMNPYAADVPLFTPNHATVDFFSSPRFLKFTDHMAMASSSPTDMGTSLSPGSLMELMKELSEY